MRMQGTSIIQGNARGHVLSSGIPLSFWGGVDPESGVVIDVHHPLHGQSIAGTILVIPGSRGSCSGSGVVLQLMLNDKAPAAFVFSETEEIVTLGVVIAREMFGLSVPVLRLCGRDARALSQRGSARVAANLVLDGHEAAPVVSAHEATTRDAVELDDRDREMLRGAHGRAAQLAMQVIVEMAGLYGARRLFDVSRVHIDGCIYTGEAGLRFAEELRELGAKVRIPTTMNAISVDRRQWRSMGVDAAFGAAADRLAEAYVGMGAQPTFTCAPYLLDAPPKPGEQIAWAESNAVVYANSVLGARTMKYPDYLDICIAITGRAPLAGCHLDEGRRATVRVDVPRFEEADDVLFPLLGYHVGELTVGRIPLVRGLEHLEITDDDLKAFGAAFATMSSAPMFHVAGHTPEASNADRLPVIKDAEPIGVTLATLKDTWLRFNGHARPTKIDLVSIGSPHVSVRELARLADFCAGRRRHPGVSMMVTCSRDILARTEAADHVADLERFGVQFITDTCWCMIQEPVIPKEARTVLTNSGKYAHYGPGISGRRVLLGSLSQCVDAACEGQFDTTPPSWIMADTSDKQPRGSATAARPRKDRYE